MDALEYDWTLIADRASVAKLVAAGSAEGVVHARDCGVGANRVHADDALWRGASLRAARPHTTRWSVAIGIRKERSKGRRKDGEGEECHISRFAVALRTGTPLPLRHSHS